MSREKRLITRGLGEARPESVSDYEKLGGFAALKKALELPPEEIIAEIKKAKLLGRGGAAYPAGNKWEHLLRIPERPKYVVCNADEGEPGTFKDKLILDKLPLRLVEGMAVAGAVFRAAGGYIYVRGEYRAIQKRFQKALGSAREANYLGRNILGSGFDFDIEIVSGAGAYVCGENSALLNSTEGRVGRPRIKPPHLAEVGLFQKPTLVNNVETFASVPLVLEMGGRAYLELGHPESGGTKLVCLSGHVKRPGVYEIPLGSLTLRELIFDSDFGDGVPGGGAFKFGHLGGQSGPIFSQEKLDAVYSYADLRKAGLSVGSGAVVVMDSSVSVLAYLKKVAAFFVHESCGKCVPCREGNRAVLKRLSDLEIPSALSRSDLEDLANIAAAMSRASFCGLGQSAATHLKTAWKAFPAEFERNLRENAAFGAGAR
ncbi:MAG: NADH-quinone oxidoreductase subunit F [Deltaproteobacteria bacterium]|jgi:NADH-quinone oxidoreductase subunit F|nr:NADH-quinone oxidoreductase subunit F [Deltaproteobacteria bacterium]